MELYDERTDTVFKKYYTHNRVSNSIENCYSEKSVYIHETPSLDFSVIVPCYNGETYIQKCLDALARQQTKYSYEILLVDDGSNDNTLSILEDYARRDNNFRAITQSNGGTASARNTGIRESRGRYLLFVDSDDSISERYFESLIDEVIGTKADICACGYTTIFENGKYKRTISPKSNHDRSILNGCPWGKVFNRKLFEHILWPEGYWYEDTILVWLIYPNVNEIVTIDSCEYIYYSSSTNTTKSSVKKSKSIDTLYMTDLVLQHVEELTPDGWKDSQECLSMTIEQFYINHRRLIGQDKICRRELFRLQKEYMSRYYSGITVNGVSNPMYEKALRAGSFNMAEMAVNLDKIYKALNAVRRHYA